MALDAEMEKAAKAEAAVADVAEPGVEANLKGD